MFALVASATRLVGLVLVYEEHEKRVGGEYVWRDRWMVYPESFIRACFAEAEEDWVEGSPVEICCGWYVTAY